MLVERRCASTRRFADTVRRVMWRLPASAWSRCDVWRRFLSFRRRQRTFEAGSGHSCRGQRRPWVNLSPWAGAYATEPALNIPILRRGTGLSYGNSTAERSISVATIGGSDGLPTSNTYDAGAEACHFEPGRFELCHAAASAASTGSLQQRRVWCATLVGQRGRRTTWMSSGSRTWRSPSRCRSCMTSFWCR